MQQLENRKILITGATRGLGAELAVLLAGQGADIAIVGRDAMAGEDVARQIRALGRQAIVIAADVADEPAMLAAGEQAVACFGHVDRLLCVAGLSSPRKPLTETSTAEFHAYFDVNVLGAALAMRAVLPSMIERSDGRIVLIGGTYGYKGVANSSLYVATKWALRGLARSVALEVGKHGITVNVVAPGGVDGPRLRDEFAASARREGIAPEAVYQRFTGRTALGSLVDSQDIAQSVIHLFSDGGRRITGQDILIDAGTIV
jgi:NAD(P)-dependent dehydrogenase (short-subunit alcohol dehydrogenase family)